MNLGLRCGQLLAERSNIKRMNIVERTRLWYRLERIGQETEPIDSKQTSTLTSVPSYRQLKDDIDQLKARLIHAENKWNEYLDKKKSKGGRY